MCDLDVTGAPSIFKIIRSVVALARIFPILDLICEENAGDGSGTNHGDVAQVELLKLQKIGQFPDETVKN